MNDRENKDLKNSRSLAENVAIILTNSINENVNAEKLISRLCEELVEPELSTLIDFSIYSDVKESKLTLSSLDTYDRDFLITYFNCKIFGYSYEEFHIGLKLLISKIESMKEDQKLFNYYAVKKMSRQQRKNYIVGEEFYSVDKGDYTDLIKIQKTGEEKLLIGKLEVGTRYYTIFKNKDNSFCVLKDIIENKGKYSSVYNKILIFECDSDPSGIVEMPYTIK